MAKLAYSRALLKLSGESFAGGRASGIDFGVIERLSDELKQVAATNPLAVRIANLPPETVARERQVYEAQVAEQKKPENIRAKIVDGMMKKFYEENVLLEQKFVKDDKRTVGELVKELSAKTGEKIDVRRFARLKVGEG